MMHHALQGLAASEVQAPLRALQRVVAQVQSAIIPHNLPSGIAGGVLLCNLPIDGRPNTSLSVL